MLSCFDCKPSPSNAVTLARRLMLPTAVPGCGAQLNQHKMWVRGDGREHPCTITFCLKGMRRNNNTNTNFSLQFLARAAGDRTSTCEGPLALKRWKRDGSTVARSGLVDQITESVRCHTHRGQRADGPSTTHCWCSSLRARQGMYPEVSVFVKGCVCVYACMYACMHVCMHVGMDGCMYGPV